MVPGYVSSTGWPEDFVGVTECKREVKTAVLRKGTAAPGEFEVGIFGMLSKTTPAR
jgi:hypothetical protein